MGQSLKWDFKLETDRRTHLRSCPFLFSLHDHSISVSAAPAVERVSLNLLLEVIDHQYFDTIAGERWPFLLLGLNHTLSSLGLSVYGAVRLEPWPSRSLTCGQVPLPEPAPGH
jgi:hypothetical protein